MDQRTPLNLLRARRKKTALSQDELAYLLGAKDGAQVSRYENLIRLPELQTALALEVIFDSTVSSLFPELFHHIESDVRRRARALARKQLNGRNGPFLARKRQALNSICDRLIKKKHGE